MPSLTTYERKRLTETQYHALRHYIARKRTAEGPTFHDINNGVQNDSPNEADASCENATASSPAEPSAREIREQKEQALDEMKQQLAELEIMLTKLKEKKHQLFEELKSSLVDSKKHETREKQMQGFPLPFMPHPIPPGPPMINISPFRPGMKRPKSPSPPLVQLYSPLTDSSNVQKPFPQMGSRMPGPLETVNPGYQFQQTFSQQDQLTLGPRVNLLPNSVRPLTASSPLPPHDRHFQSFDTSPPAAPENKVAGAFGHHPPGYAKRDNYGSSRPRYH